MRIAADVRIDVGDALRAVNDQQPDIAAFEMTARHDHAEFFGLEFGLAFARMPAVSTNRMVMSSCWITLSTASRVVPAMGETIERSSPTRRFSRVDFPTFGRPMMATRISSAAALVFGEFPAASRRPDRAAR